jgi:hypothetical protein
VCPLQGLDKAEPAHELLVRATGGVEAFGHRLPMEMYVELHAQRTVLVVATVVIHAVNVRSCAGGCVGEIPDLPP